MATQAGVPVSFLPIMLPGISVLSSFETRRAAENSCLHEAREVSNCARFHLTSAVKNAFAASVSENEVNEVVANVRAVFRSTPDRLASRSPQESKNKVH